MSQFFKVLFRHSPKEDGKYRQMETVYHLHGDTDGYDNHRCSLTEDGNYFCPGCKQNFSKEEINRYPYRDLPHNKSYWLESRRSGQHLPHNEKDIFWTHVHPQDDILKKKPAEVDFSKIFATCPVCEKMLNLHTWQESNPKNKQLAFPGIVMENISISIWKELKIFLEENVEIWLQDKDGKFFFLSNQLQLLPAENQEGILVCGDRLFLDNDDRKCLLFQVDEISQALIDEHLKEALSSAEDFHLEIKMADEESEIPLKPESRRRSTKELSSGELISLQTPPEREQSQEIIVIVDGEHAETHKIPKRHKVDLNEPTPLPEDAHPLLVPDLSDTNVADSCDGFAPMELAMTDEPKMVITIEQKKASGLLMMPETASEPTMALGAAPIAAVPTITNVADSRDGFAPSELAITEQPVTDVNPAEPAMTEQPGTDVENTDDGAGEPAPANHHSGASRHCWECNKSLPADQACSDHEKVCPHCGLAYLITEQVCRNCQSDADQPEPAMTESANTGTADAPPPEPIPASKTGTRQCIICGKMLQSSPLTGEEVCEVHEKSCAICATVNPKEAIFCGGCGSPFKLRKVQITAQKPLLKEAITKIGLAAGLVGILVFIPMLFAWLINHFQSEDQKADLRAAEKRRMELSSQISKLRVEADLIRFDLLETTRDLNRVRNDISTVQTEQQRLAERQSELDNRLNNALSWEADLHDYFVKKKNQLNEHQAQLAKQLLDKQAAWQKEERERNEKRYAELRKTLFTQHCEIPRAAPITSPSLFGGNPEQETPKTTAVVEPAKSFLDELMPSLLEMNKKLAKKHAANKKAPPTLVVDKTPPPPPPVIKEVKPAKPESKKPAVKVPQKPKQAKTAKPKPVPETVPMVYFYNEY